MTLTATKTQGTSAKPPLRPVLLGPPDVVIERRSDGAIVLRSPHPLPAFPQKLTERLVHWAKAAPERVFLAQRDASGAWRTLTYADALTKVRATAAALLARGLSPERPIAILSGNDIEHASLGLAAMHVGIPCAPISVPYSLLSKDFGKLKTIIEVLQPGLVFAANGTAFARAIAAAVPPGVEVAVTESRPSDRRAILFSELTNTQPTPAVEAAHGKIAPDTIAKILFTSGSTGQPKGVINTQLILCPNRAMIRCGLAFVAAEPPVIVDWLPWNHTFGSNHNFNLVLRHGGTLYIDDGKPAPGLIERSLAALREIAPTLYFNVPLGFAMLVDHLERDKALAANFFRELDFLFYAAASLPQPIWERLERVSLATRGATVPMISAWGTTETAP